MQDRGKQPPHKRRDIDRERDLERKGPSNRQEDRPQRQDMPDRERLTDDERSGTPGRGEDADELDEPAGQARDTPYWPRRHDRPERPVKPQEPYASD